jgi:hypothetical protein
LTLAFKGFVVKSQIPNLIPAPSFDHNSCKLSLNEQSKAFEASMLQNLCNGFLGAQFGACFPF